MSDLQENRTEGKPINANSEAHTNLNQGNYLKLPKLRGRTDQLKVLVAAPFFSIKAYCVNDWVKMLGLFSHPNYDIFLVDTSEDPEFHKTVVDFNNITFPVETQPWLNTTRKRQTLAYNRIREYFLAGDWDYLFTCESDVFPQPEVITKLLEHDLDVVGAIYYLGYDKDKKPCMTTGDHVINQASFVSHFHGPWTLNGELREIKGGCGFGATLIKRKVLEKIRFRWDALHADTYFHEDCKRFGFKTHVDTSQVCRHYPSLETYRDF